jgi:hypothetical protein
MRLIVCGGRDFKERERAFEALDAVHAKTPITTIVHGGAGGADTIADEWAASRGVPVEVFLADWKKQRRAAGPIRNQKMADSGAGACMALPGGSGTADMCRRAAAANIPVWKPLG